MMKNIIDFLKRNRRGAISTLILLAVGAAYYVFTEITDIYIPCVFRFVTGLACPGCGISHFISDMISLDFVSAIRQNIGLAILLVFWCAVGIVYIIFRPEGLRKNGKVFNILIWGSVVFLVVFGIARNLPQFQFLLPLYNQSI